MAGHDLKVAGSSVVGDKDVNLVAANAISIEAATNQSRETHYLDVKESGLLSGGGFGISFGKRTTTTNQEQDASTQSGLARSTIGSIGGNVSMNAGDAIRIVGSDLTAGHDLNLVGKSVSITPGLDALSGKYATKMTQDAFTLALTGSVVNAIQTAQQMDAAASQVKSGRLKALAAATTAMAGANAASDIAANGPSIGVSLTVGHSESEQTATTASTTHVGSAITAGNNINVAAIGGGTTSNIDILGSDLRAKNNINLAADNQVNLLAAQDSESQHSQSKSMSAAAGVAATVGTKGVAYGFTASASLSRGSADGEGTTQVNTHVDAGGQLKITSGGDTNLKGAVAIANQVVADVKGNLNIESLQDTAKFDSKNQSLSVSATVGVGASVSGSVNQSKVHNDYASVQEQSGIRAGDGGFQVAVGGNTDLKGGVISSSNAGAASSSLMTATLTQSDIANHVAVDASSVGISGGVKVAGQTGNAPKAESEAGSNSIFHLEEPKGATGVSLSGAAVSSNESGTTRSGVGAGTLVITDDVGQRRLTGQTAEQAAAGVNRNVITGSDTSGRVANTFNPNATNAALEISGAFNSLVVAPLAEKAANIVGDIGKAKEDAAQRQADAYNQLAAAAAQRGDTQEALALNAKAKDAQDAATTWSDNGLNRLALHAATQGLIGSLAGGGTGASTGIAGVAGGNLGQQLGESLGNAEADKRGLPPGKDREDLVNAYKETAATIGGAIAGLAASSANGSGGDKLVRMMQGASTATAVDVFNRQLHDSEKKIAQKLATASNGKYTAGEIEAAMRAAGNSAFHEDVTTGMVVPLTSSTSPKDIYDTTGMLLTNDDAGHSFLVQQIPSHVDPGLATYIRENTGGGKSAYTWNDSTLGIVAPSVPTGQPSPFTPNATGCVTAECAAGILGNRNHAAGETQVLGGVQAIVGSAQAIGGGTLVATGLASCAETLGAGCVVAAVGGFQMLAGWDNANTGTKVAIDAKPHATMGGELLQKVGFARADAELIYGGAQWVTGYGA